MKLGDFLNKLFTDVGIAYDDASVKSLLSSQSVIDLDISDDLTSKVLSNLLTEEAAQANPKIKSLLTAKALNPIDSKIETLAEKHGLTDKWTSYRMLTSAGILMGVLTHTMPLKSLMNLLLKKLSPSFQE